MKFNVKQIVFSMKTQVNFSNIFGIYQSLMIFSTGITSTWNVYRTLAMNQNKKSHDGCKAIEPIYFGSVVIDWKIRIQKRLFTLSPMLKWEEDSDMVKHLHIFYPTMDVRPLKLYYASCVTFIWIFKTQKHRTSGVLRKENLRS